MREDGFIDSATREVLDVGAYMSWLDAQTPAGRRRIQSLDAYGSGERGVWKREIERSRQTEKWAEDHPAELSSLRDALSNLPETERALRRLRIGETLDESDLFAVKRFAFYAHACLTAASDLLDRDQHTGDWTERAEIVMDRIHPEKRRSSRFHLASALDEELAASRRELRAIKRRERELREDLERTLLEDFEGRFDIQGHFRPAEGCSEAELQGDARLTYAAGAWQLRDPALDAVRDEREAAQEAVDSAEYRVREALTDDLVDHLEWLEAVEFALAEIDVQLAKAQLRQRVGGTWPDWSDDQTRVVGGTEFGVLRMLEDSEESVQPVDVELGEEPAVVSGPNMGGKSSLLRLVGLSQWAAQHALPVPARAYSFVPVEAIIYVGSEEPLAEQMTEGLSSFGREVHRLVQWWERGDAPRLWLLDEVGRGTHPDEGARIAREIIEQLTARGDRCIAATHFPAVAGMEGARKLRIAGLTDPTMLDQLIEGAEQDEPAALQRALRAAMDYRPLPVEEHDVPRDARVVARALGLSLDD
ncbi:MAG: MutS-related protein [Myxococcota bacterium]